MIRNETRKQRQDKKTPVWMPVSVCTVNFNLENNLAFCLRSAGCFGAKTVHVIGKTNLKRSHLNAMSGTMTDYVNLQFHKNPMAFLDFSRERKIKLVSLEIAGDLDTQYWLDSYKFDFKNDQGQDQDICIVGGNEQTGIPIEILKNSDIVGIRMMGPGFCINTSQAINIALYEISKQYYSKIWQEEKVIQKLAINLLDGQL